MTEPRFPWPLRATKHCRHYSYVLPVTRKDSGPHCAVGIDLSEPGATKRCMPDSDCPCHAREDYTQAERDAWAAAKSASLDRLVAAIDALPHPIPLNTSGTVLCPSCDGRLSYARWHRGAEIACSDKTCCGSRFNVAAGADWPVRAA